MARDRVLRGIARADLSRRIGGPKREPLDHNGLDLQAAISRHELALHFQPIIELRTGRCYRAEGLATWMHPRVGVIESRDVVRLAEQSNAALPLAAWTVREALRVRTTWQDNDLELGVSLNLVGSELLAGGAEQIVDVIRTARARPAVFTFEVPAAAFARDVEIRRGLRVLATAGCRVALDEVTEANLPGRTSIVEIDEQKLARSIVLRASSDAASALSLKRLLALGKDLGLATVAVGVEDEATYRMLVALGCDLAQGYWMSRPLATSDVAQWHTWLARAVLAGSTAITAFSGLAKIAQAATAPVRDPLAGPGTTVSAVATTPGNASSCCALRVPGGVADVGVSTRTVAVDGANVHLEGTLSDADAARVIDAVSRDVAATQHTFGVSFSATPDVYVFASRGSFALGLQRGFGQRATDASALAAGNGGVAFSDRAAIAVNWQNVSSDGSLAIVRHELTHLLAHQIAGPDAELPAWFDEGLATVMERGVVADASRDAVADSATLSMLHRGEASLQDLSAPRDWTMKNAALGGNGYTLAAAGVGVLLESIGQGGVTALLQHTHEVGFAQAFGQATGASPADFSLSFPGRFAASHSGVHLAQVPVGESVKWAVAGLAADTKAHVNIDGAGYHVGFDVTADRYGTYTAMFGGTAAAGDYTITVIGPSGTASTSVSIGGR